MESIFFDFPGFQRSNAMNACKFPHLPPDGAFSPADFPDSATDSAAIQAAIDAAAAAGTFRVTIPAWNSRAQSAVWTINEAIRLPSGMTVVLDNCRLVMADGVFCNMFTNEHAWTPDRNTAAAEDREITIVGLGHPVLDGGKYNGWGERSTPAGPDDSIARNVAAAARIGKRLVNNCLIYFHNVRDFRIEGLHLRHQRYWAACFVFCSFGEIRNIRFEADITWMSEDAKTLDPTRLPVHGQNLWVKNGDGIDLRVGCHDILVENISGFTEDDTVALTNLNGSERADLVEGKSTDICRISVRNVRTGTWLWMYQVRLLAADGRRIHDVDIDTVVDTPQPHWPWRNRGAVLVNSPYDEYFRDRNEEMGDMWNVSIANIWSRAASPISIFRAVDGLDIRNVHTLENCHAAILCQADAVLKNARISGIFCPAVSKIGSILDFVKVDGELHVSDVFADQAEHLMRTSGTAKVVFENGHVGNLTGARVVRADDGPHWFDDTEDTPN